MFNEFHHGRRIKGLIDDLLSNRISRRKEEMGEARDELLPRQRHRKRLKGLTVHLTKSSSCIQSTWPPHFEISLQVAGKKACTFGS